MKVNMFSIALRNLTRHTSKTVTTTLAVVIVIAAYILIDGMFTGMDIESRRNIVNYEVGSSKIYKKAYYDIKDERPMYECFDNWEPIVSLLDKNGFNSAPRFVFGGSLIGEEVELPFMFYGVDPESEKATFGYSDYIVSGGKYIESGNFDIVLGVNGASDLGAKVGDLITLSTIIDEYDENGKIIHRNEILTLEIVGLLNSTNNMLNGNIGYIPIDILRDENGLYIENNITEICIRKKGADKHALPDKKESTESVAAILSKEFTLKDYMKNVTIGKVTKNENVGYIFDDNELLLINWKEDVLDFIAVASSKQSISSIFVILLFFLSFIGINNTMLMAVMDRTKETGMLRSLGMTDGEVVRLFLYEAFFIGLLGGLIGIALGCLGNVYMVNHGLDFTKALEGFSGSFGYRSTFIFKSAWNPSIMIFSGLLAIVASVVASIAPSRLAVKKTIADALRFE